MLTKEEIKEMCTKYVDMLPLPPLENGICEALYIVVFALDCDEKAIRNERKTPDNLKPHKSKQFRLGYQLGLDLGS